MEKLHRSRTNKVIGGVCGGLGESLGVDPILLRLAFVAAFLFMGAGPLIYLVLWIVLPAE